MANKSGDVNKTQAIVDYKKARRSARPKEIAAALGEQGIEVSPGYVSSILSNKRRKKGKRAKGTAEAAPVADKVSLSMLLEAKKLAEQLGGVGKAKAALDALHRLQ